MRKSGDCFEKEIIEGTLPGKHTTGLQWEREMRANGELSLQLSRKILSVMSDLQLVTLFLTFKFKNNTLSPSTFRCQLKHFCFSHY